MFQAVLSLQGTGRLSAAFRGKPLLAHEGPRGDDQLARRGDGCLRWLWVVRQR